MNSIRHSKTWTRNLDEVLETLSSDLSLLDDASVLVTGATGLICSAVVDLLLRYNETQGGRVRVIVAGRDEAKAKARFGSDVAFVCWDATASRDTADVDCDYIIHGASNASPDLYCKEPVETMMANIVGLKNLLDCARASRAKRLLYVSSSEVYGNKEGNEAHLEDEYGYINLLNARSSYAVAKRAAETLCVSYTAEHGVETVIVRPGHIYGPTASASDVRVSSAWARDVAEGRDIVMKSNGAQLRSYCHCLDCASAIIKVLLRGEPAQAYNISNPDSVITIKQMAEVLAQVANVRLLTDIPTEQERNAFNPMTNSSLDGRRLLSLGWQPVFGTEKGLGDTVRVNRESRV